MIFFLSRQIARQQTGQVISFTGESEFIQKTHQIVFNCSFVHLATLNYGEHKGFVLGRLLTADVPCIFQVHLDAPHHLLTQVVRQLDITAFQYPLHRRSLSECVSDCLFIISRPIRQHHARLPAWIFAPRKILLFWRLQQKPSLPFDVYAVPIVLPRLLVASYGDSSSGFRRNTSSPHVRGMNDDSNCLESASLRMLSSFYPLRAYCIKIITFILAELAH